MYLSDMRKLFDKSLEIDRRTRQEINIKMASKVETYTKAEDCVIYAGFKTLTMYDDISNKARVRRNELSLVDGAYCCLESPR